MFLRKILKIIWTVVVESVYVTVGLEHCTPDRKRWHKSEDYKKWSVLPANRKESVDRRYTRWLTNNSNGLF